MRIGIISLQQESNTFLDGQASFEHFEQDQLVLGEDIRKALADAPHEIGGFFEGLDDARIEAVGIFAARAFPYGTTTAETLRRLMEIMFGQLRRAGQLDALLVAPHGAMVSESHRDVDGYWLSRLRQQVGPRMPIVGTLDPHANLSPAMVDATDALIAYRTNPHLDQRQCGRQAAELLSQTLGGHVRPVQAAAFPPLSVGIERQLTSAPPCLPWYELADSQLRGEGVLSNSILLGFPYADVEEMGSCTLAVTDDDPALAQQLADALARYAWDHREEFVGELIRIDEALDWALDRVSRLDGPVLLLDMGDNVGGGSAGDGTFLAQALCERLARDRDSQLAPAFVCLYDPESVQLAAAAGVGKRSRLSVGGKTDDLHGTPLEAEWRVVSLHDGKFTESEARHGGHTVMDQGPTAIVLSDHGLTVMLTSRRMVPFSLNQLTSCGLAPESFRVLVAKGVHAPIAAYESVCRHRIRVDTPGSTPADARRLAYHHRRRPMFPFERETQW